jgi:plasmid stability protein
MATLYVENIPDDLYEALRGRARSRRRSIAAEVLALLEENIPTEQELKARQELLRRLIRMRAKRTTSRRAFPSSEEMLRKDRER